MSKYPFQYQPGPPPPQHTFGGKYRIEGHGDTEFCSSDDLGEVRKRIVATNRGKTLQIFVYANPEGSTEADNTGRYIFSSHATAVAEQIDRAMTRQELR